LVRGWIIVLPPLEELKEFFRPAFLKQAHERARDRLHLSARDLGNPTVTVDEAASDHLELEISGDIGMDQDFGELSRRYYKFRNEVYGIVAVTPERRRGRLLWSELAIEL
jgi:hypothetical protein